MTLILSNDDVEKCLSMRECIEVLEDAYAELSAGRGVNRVRSDCLVPPGMAMRSTASSRWTGSSRNWASGRSASIPIS